MQDNSRGQVREGAIRDLVLADMTAAQRRQSAYRAESDPLAIRAQRLAWLNDPAAETAKAEYLAKVADIQARFP
jgi:hypothetical protein